jgi:hypothetical protein
MKYSKPVISITARIPPTTVKVLTLAVMAFRLVMYNRGVASILNPQCLYIKRSPKIIMVEKSKAIAV